MTPPRLSLIVAMGDNRVIGREGTLPWHLPADLRHFKATTLGSPIVMGRRTFASIGRTLPGRRNLVLTRDPAYSAPGVEVYGSLDEALAACRDEPEVFVIGGAELFAAAFPLAHRLWLTRVHCAPEGDTWFPEFENDGSWQLVSSEDHPSDEDHAYRLTFELWQRGGSAGT